MGNLDWRLPPWCWLFSTHTVQQLLRAVPPAAFSPPEQGHLSHTTHNASAAHLHLPLGTTPNQKGSSEQHFRNNHSDSGPFVVTTAFLHVEVRGFLAMIQKKPHDCFALGSPEKRVYRETCIQTHPIEFFRWCMRLALVLSGKSGFSRKIRLRPFCRCLRSGLRVVASSLVVPPSCSSAGDRGSVQGVQVLWKFKFLLRDAQMSSIGRKRKIRNTENVSVRLCGQMEAMHSPMWSVAGLLDVKPNGTLLRYEAAQGGRAGLRGVRDVAGGPAAIADVSVSKG
ncbi:hypothetical protein EDB86DRAFT_2827810 [Lactarius hatsudake]|nr:hypothetical protein EDB86DRAFT_2827810 [Lactarius hatsudake]